MNWLLLFAALLLTAVPSSATQIVFDATSAYHHIRVVDDRGLRVLSFDGSLETRMSLSDPLRGHFEYTEYFHMPWLWNPNQSNVLMIGLGGGSIQRSYQKYHPLVSVETAEMDPLVLKVAREYFHFKDSPTNRVIISDGRMYLRRSEKKYDLIIMDAYVKSRYGSCIPHHLVTKEFFQLADDHLSTNGILAYNVMGSFQGWRADILGAVYRTLKTVFPQVYLFPANDSLNVVLIATKSKVKLTQPHAVQLGAERAKSGPPLIPTFQTRVKALRSEPPPGFLRSPILTDDFAPVDGLLRGRN